LPPKFSIIPVRAFEDISLNPAALKVLASLGAYANRRGYCYPSQSTLAKRLHVSRQAVNRQVRILAEHGYLKIAHRVHTSGAELSCLYQILFDDPAENKGKITQDEKPDIDLSRPNDLLNHRKKEDPGKTNPLLPEKENVLIKNQEMDTSIRSNRKLQDKTAETAPVSVPQTISIEPSETLLESLPEPAVVAQTPYLTPKLTPRVDGRDSSPRLSNRVTHQLPADHSAGNSERGTPFGQLDSQPNPDSHFNGRLRDKIGSVSSTNELQDNSPDLQLYLSITHHQPLARELDTVILALRVLRMIFPDDTRLRTFLEPYWQRWCASRRSNGAHYSHTNTAWLTDWALSAAMQKHPTFHTNSMVSNDSEVFRNAMTPTPESYT
jgi:hypothetical protein